MFSHFAFRLSKNIHSTRCPRKLCASAPA